MVIISKAFPDYSATLLLIDSKHNKYVNPL